MFNYKCPNGYPPEVCVHIPQLILNAVSYFQQKQQMHKDSTETKAQLNVGKTSGTNDGLQSKDNQKQRRRG